MKTVWYVEAGPMAQWARLVNTNPIDFSKPEPFRTDGQLLTWAERPCLEFHVEKRKKLQSPRSDVIPFHTDALVLNTKAHQALGSFLSRFGQLLEFDVDGEPGYYFYNVTHQVSCLDRERSVFSERGTLRQEMFLDAAVPVEPMVFKEPLIRPRLYTNDAGKQVLEDMVKAHGITGLVFRRASLSAEELAAWRERDAAVTAASAAQLAALNAKPKGKMTSVLFAIEAGRLKPLINKPEALAEPMTAHGKDGLGVRDFLDLDEAWQAIHFLLTGTDFDTAGPLGRATMGGREIRDTQIGYGTPTQVKATARALAAITPEQLAWRFRPAAMIEAGIYPDRWEGEGAMTIGDILPYYEKLRAFYAAATERGDAVLSIVP
jgi:hypothetical protein